LLALAVQLEREDFAVPYVEGALAAYENIDDVDAVALATISQENRDHRTRSPSVKFRDEEDLSPPPFHSGAASSAGVPPRSALANRGGTRSRSTARSPPRYNRSASRPRSPRSASRDRHHSRRSASRPRPASQGRSRPRSASRHRDPPSRGPALAIGIETDISRITDTPSRSGVGQFQASRLTEKSMDYPGAASIRKGLPTRTVVNRDAKNTGPGPGQGVGRCIAICKKYNAGLCLKNIEECNHAHVCFFCVDWEHRHRACDCLAPLGVIVRMQAADTLRGHRAT